ncbi:unnamed protein product [Triticum turgidum subsp. durum]|uniref:Uncharacterized protein n=1 Tax=Triticum turgidum subsp. durum TaxID=4567 RepID=A0A9R1PUZ0_TRITD|nr:unnamed protein product [Triticum turgidum subsp. durum]
MKGGSGGGKESATGSFLRFLLLLLLPLTALYFFYTLHLLLASAASSSAASCPPDPTAVSSRVSTNRTAAAVVDNKAAPAAAAASTATTLQHVVFGIAASSRFWDKRKEYIKVWWRPRGAMRGYVWLDREVRESNMSTARTGLPAIKISSDTSAFPYMHRRGHRSAIRISRIVSETFRLGLPGVRWFVMGDDDTVFFPDNLLTVLNKFDHRQPYYIGSLSESHLQNIYFSYGMAYGGGGFAISRPLAEALARIQDGCISRYPALYGSDDRIQACMAELGVPLTKHPGFHQYDVYGDLLGLLAAHPVAPIVTLHHLDVVQPLFPNAPARPAAVRRLFSGPVKLDPAGIMPARTFLNWYRRADYTAYAFNTRPLARTPCHKPAVYYLSSARSAEAARGGETTVTRYERWRPANETRPACRWNITDPDAHLDHIVVLKRPDPGIWDRSPRRNCCRVLSSPKVGKEGKKTMTIDVGVCRDGEFSQVL